MNLRHAPMLVPLAVLGAASALPADAQAVYRCVVDGVATYAGQPCSATAHALEMPPPPKTDPHELQMRAAARARMAAQARDDQLDELQAGCVRRLSRATRHETGRQIAQARADIAELQSRRVVYQPTVAGATWAQTWMNGVEAQIAARQATIDRARQRRITAIANARSLCASARAAAVNRDD